MQLALRRPDRFMQSAPSGCERSGATKCRRAASTGSLHQLSRLAYWAGVAEALGGRHGWDRFVDVIENARPIVRRDVAAGVGELVHGADVDVVLDDDVGRVPARRVRWRGRPRTSTRRR